jgi:ribonuclease P protein component
MRKEHLKGRNEIRKVFEEGRQFFCRGAKLFVLKSDLPHNRICFTFPKNFGNAVARNRAKRLGREAFRLFNNRLFNNRLCGGYDFILLVYPEEDMALSGRLKQFEVLFNKAGLLK